MPKSSGFNLNSSISAEIQNLFKNTGRGCLNCHNMDAKEFIYPDAYLRESLDYKGKIAEIYCKTCGFVISFRIEK